MCDFSSILILFDSNILYWSCHRESNQYNFSYQYKILWVRDLLFLHISFLISHVYMLILIWQIDVFSIKIFNIYLIKTFKCTLVITCTGINLLLDIKLRCFTFTLFTLVGAYISSYGSLITWKLPPQLLTIAVNE